MRILIAGSVKPNIPQKYIEETEKLGTYIAEKKYDVICCADKLGIVGKVYSKITENNSCKVILAMPKCYMHEAEGMEQGVDKITDTINERTDYIIKNSDVAVFLPGGIGTIYELLTTIETRKAGEHDSKIIIVNMYGFFDNLLKMLDKAYEENFAKIENKDLYYVADSIENTINYIEKIEEVGVGLKI